VPVEPTNLLYLAALLTSVACILLVDWRYSLFIFGEPLRASIILVIGAVFFLLWDIAGIALGIFFQGTGPYMTGIMLGPELPLEELVFLLFLCHITMVLVLGSQRVLGRRAES
jgi:lycopene cyclase domain-containing protein